MNIAYIGYSDVLLKYVLCSHDFIVKKIIYVEKRVSEKYKSLVEKNRIQTLKIDTKDDIWKIDKFVKGVDIIIMYKFEYILSQQLVDNYRIFNFHGGNLRTNRGAHAVVRSILNNEKETMLSLYELTGGIDVGLLVGEHHVALSKDETVHSLNMKLQEGILPLLHLLKEYLDGKTEAILVESGVYYPKIVKADYTLDVENDSFEKMDAILRSQIDYDGAICYVNGCEVRIKKWKIESCEERTERNIYYEKDKIIIKDMKQQMIMYITQ